MNFQNFLERMDPIFRRISATMPTAGVVAPAHAAAVLAADTAGIDRANVAPLTASFPAQMADTGALRAA